MMRITRADAALAQELKVLIEESTPYALSTPSLGTPTFHDFVKGLVLSTNIIQVVDRHIPNGHRADWGQLIDEVDGNILSRECDIIIYSGKPYKFIQNKCMRYVLAVKTQTKVVIQVRSGIHSVSRDDRIYSRDLKRMVPQLWYFAECCWAKTKKRADDIRRDLRGAGYKQFFYLYRMDPDRPKRTIDYEQFIRFVQLVKNIS